MDDYQEENYTAIGNFGFYKQSDGKSNVAARLFFSSMEDETPALTTAAILLSIYSSLESKIPDSQQIAFKQDVLFYLETAFPNLGNMISIE